MESLNNAKENPSYDDWNNIVPDDYYKKSAGETDSTTDILPTPEEKEKTLTFEAMSKLSTPEYLEKWRTLNPFFVTYSAKNSANIPKSLKSNAETQYNLPKNFTEADLSLMLDDFVEKNNIDLSEWHAETITKLLPINIPFSDSDAWSEAQSVRFSQNHAPNNGIFFVFPTDLIASQCRFKNNSKNLTMSNQDSDDLSVWPNDKIPTDAGLAFIPDNENKNWERHFAEHPEEKPAHIVYYSGSPTEAVESLLTAHNILESAEQTLSGPGASVERDGKLLGFDSHYVEEPREDENLQSEHDRFNNLALKILKEKQVQ